ncbi:hypothetical protein Tco_0846496 [Tanacetum coccineum]
MGRRYLPIYDQKGTSLSQKVLGQASRGLTAGDEVEQTDEIRKSKLMIELVWGRRRTTRASSHRTHVNMCWRDASSPAQELPAPSTHPLILDARCETKIASDGNVDSYL